MNRYDTCMPRAGQCQAHARMNIATLKKQFKYNFYISSKFIKFGLSKKTKLNLYKYDIRRKITKCIGTWCSW